MVPASASVFLADKIPEMASASIYVPRGSFHCLLLLQEALQDQQMGMTQAPFRLLTLPWVLEHVRFCMHSFTVESLFYRPLALMYMAFKVSHSGGSSLCRSLELGSQMWDLDPSLPWENSHNCDYPSLCELPPASVGFDYTASPLLLPILWWFLLYIFNCEKSFLLVFRSFL